MKNFKKIINFIKEYELEANLSCLITGMVIGKYPIVFLQALSVLFVAGMLILTVVLMYAASDGEQLDHGYIKAITKKEKK